MTRLIPATVAATVGLLVLSPAPAGATATTVALWHLDETSGTTMIDASGHGHNGAISNVQLGVPGEYYTGYGFDGTSSIVTVPDSPELNPGTAPLTISAWLQLPTDLTTGDYNVIQKGMSHTAGGDYKLEVHGMGGKFGYPDCVFTGGSGKVHVYGPNSIADGQWHHIVCTLTSSGGAIWDNGVLGQTQSGSVGSIANTVPVTIGGKPNFSHYYRGNLDEVSITIG